MASTTSYVREAGGKDDTVQLDEVVSRIYQYEDNPQKLEEIKGELRLPNGTLHSIGQQLKNYNPDLFTKLFGSDVIENTPQSVSDRKRPGEGLSHPPQQIVSLASQTDGEGSAKRRKIDGNGSLVEMRANLETWLVQWKKDLSLQVRDCVNLSQESRDRIIERVRQAKVELEIFFAHFPQKNDDENAFKKSIHEFQYRFISLQIDLDEQGKRAAKEAMEKCDEYLSCLQRQKEIEEVESSKLIEPEKEKAIQITLEFEATYDPSPAWLLSLWGTKKEFLKSEGEKMIKGVQEEIRKARTKQALQAALKGFKETLESQHIAVDGSTVQQCIPFIAKIQAQIDSLSS